MTGAPSATALGEHRHAWREGLRCSAEFYRHLRWPQAFDSDDFAVFELRGAVLTLFPVDKLAADSRAQPELGGGGIRFNIIISVDSPQEVDELADRARPAGGTLTKGPVDDEFFAEASQVVRVRLPMVELTQSWRRPIAST